MADVEMSDAPGAVVKKADGAGNKSVEGKKKFEVKKVSQPVGDALPSPVHPCRSNPEY